MQKFVLSTIMWVEKLGKKRDWETMMKDRRSGR